MSSRNFRESSSILKKEKTYSKKRRRYQHTSPLHVLENFQLLLNAFCIIGLCLRYTSTAACRQVEDFSYRITKELFNFWLRSDPGPELLQPINARDESPSVESEYLDIDDSRLPISATQRGETDDNESRGRRKKIRVFDVDADDEKNVPRQASRSGYRSGGSAKKLYPSAGYEAPLGMTFIPLCSACDESTDEATDEE